MTIDDFFKSISIPAFHKGTRKSKLKGIDIDAYIKKYGPIFKQILSDLYGKQFTEFTIERVAVGMAARDLPPDFYDSWKLNVDTWAETKLKPVIGEAIRGGAVGFRGTGGILTEISSIVGEDIFFNASTKEALSFVKVQTANLVTFITEDIRDNIRGLIAEAVQNRWGTRETAKQLKKIIPLNRPQSRYWIKYQRELPNKLTERFKKMFPDLSKAKIARKVNNVKDVYLNREYNRLLNYRANMIADTELTRIKIFSELESIRQAQSAGAIKRAVKTWRSTSIADKWDSTVLYDGKTIDVNASFFEIATPGYTTMLDGSGPGEINERCYLEYDIYY
jgi:hypothetical protein